MQNPTLSVTRPASWLTRHYPLLLGVLALLPLMINLAAVEQLFWFGDDWDLLSQITREGLWTWITKPWVESYSPVFKFVWGSSVFIFQGSYFGLLAVLWISHMLAMTLFGYGLRLAGFGWGAVATALAITALTSTNIETLCWSVQLSPMLANMFFVAAVLLHMRAGAVWRWRSHCWIVAFIAASALCYSRGVLTGVVLAAMALAPMDNQPQPSIARRSVVAVAYILPSLVVTAVILMAATGNQQAVLAGQTDKFLQMLQFALWYFCLNPFYHLLEISSWGSSVAWTLGAVKVALIVGALWKSRGQQRWFLTLLLLFDLGNAALLGLGRFHTGLQASVSSRYQYCALLATIPFVVFWLEFLLHRFPTRLHLRSLVASGLAAAVAIMMLCGWKPALGPFVDWRGIQPRTILLSADPLPVAYETPGIPGLPPLEARDLIARYHLH